MNPKDAKKQYGQNFLTDPRIPRRIVALSGIGPDDNALEIGPGRGILTRELAKTAKKVVAVEIDEELIPGLKEAFAGESGVTVISGDFLKTDLASIAKEHFESERMCVCANIPYYITSPIILKLLAEREYVKSFTVMVQKEFAERVCAEKSTPAYSSLTLLCDYYATVKRLFTVPAGCFTPRPKVDSAVVRFDLRERPAVRVKDEKLLLGLIRAAFAYRRKTLVNCVQNACGERFPREMIEHTLARMGCSASARGESLDIDGFAFLSDALTEYEENK